LHPKRKEVEGKRNRFSIAGKVEAEGTLIFHADASDWELQRALHKILVKLENGVKKKYKTEEDRYLK